MILFQHNLLERLLAIYSEVLPVIRDILREQERTLGGAVYLELRGHVRQSRHCILNTANAIVQKLTYYPAVDAAEHSDEDQADEFAEKYFQVKLRLVAVHGDQI